MRYRVKDYRVEVNENIVWLYFQAPDEIILTSKSDNEIEDYILQAIRLVVDESAGIVLCSSMQKHKYIQHAKANINTQEVQLAFNIPSGKTVGNDLFTIEMDWGDTISDNIPTDYAKETTAQQAASDAAVAKTAAQALLPIAQAAEAYNTGKIQLAKNITAKGVEASATETLPELAEKVSAITQESYTIDGGEMYAKQLFGSLETPNYWNLYEVMEALLSDGRLVSYGGVLLAEYYRGYDSLAFGGDGAPSCGAGGGYVFSDDVELIEDESGLKKLQVKDGHTFLHTQDEVHYWDDDMDHKADRWVAWLFAAESHGFEISSQETCPRVIHIGKHVGVISSSVNGKLSDIIVTDGNLLDDFRTGSYQQEFGKKINILNIDNHNSGYLLYRNKTCESLYIKANHINSCLIAEENGSHDSKISSIVIDCDDMRYPIFGPHNVIYNTKFAVNYVAIKGEHINSGLAAIYGAYFNSLKHIDLIDTEDLIFGYDSIQSNPPAFSIYIGYKTNDKTKSATLAAPGNNIYENVFDVEIKYGWCKPLNVSLCLGMTEANMYAHILQRIKQDKPDCGDGVTITLGSTNLAKLTSAESVQLLDDLTNIYGYTFA